MSRLQLPDGPQVADIPPKLVQRRIRDGLMQDGPAGLEKRCPRCREMWPVDTEFWGIDRSNVDGLQDRCRACVVEEQKERRERVKASTKGQP